MQKENNIKKIIKFLYKDFNIPLQAVKARFANIKISKHWTENEDSKIQITNYLLARVMNKPLIAKIGKLKRYSHLLLKSYLNQYRKHLLNVSRTLLKTLYSKFHFIYLIFEKYNENQMPTMIWLEYLKAFICLIF